MKSLESLIAEVESWARLAPRASQCRARELISFPGMTAARVARLEDAGTAAEAEQRIAIAASVCGFPVVAGPTAPEWVQGAILSAVAVTNATWVAGTCEPAEMVLKVDWEELQRNLSPDGPSDGATLLVHPGEAVFRAVEARPDGDSCLGALLLARVAALRGVSIPGDVVVSAAVVRSGRETTFSPVDSVARKVATVAVERPNARFFVCCAERDMPNTPHPVRLIRLEPGSPFSELADQVLPASQGTFASLAASMALADTFFRQQRYEPARHEYEQVLRRLEKLPRRGSPPQTAEWVATSRMRIGAAYLHAGRAAVAREHFESVRNDASSSAVSPHLRAQTILSLVGAFIDEFWPARAKSLLRSLEREWAGEFREEGLEMKSRELKLLRVEVLGARRRVCLLEGDAGGALNFQGELRRWAPEDQLARALCDQAECLRRLGQRAAAVRALKQARRVAHRLVGDEQVQTLGFIVYTEGLIAYDGRRGLAEPGALEQLAATLPLVSAARWRLEMLAQLQRVSRGDGHAAQVLADAALAEPSPLRKWLRALGLLRGASIATAREMGLESVAAEIIKELLKLVAHHPPLTSAARRFISKVRAQADWSEDARCLQSLSAY